MLATCGSADDGAKAVESLDRMFSFWTAGSETRRASTILRRLDQAGDPPLSIADSQPGRDELLDAARLGARGIVLKAMAPSRVA